MQSLLDRAIGLKERLRIRTRVREGLHRLLRTHPFSFRTRRQKERMLKSGTLESEERALLQTVETKISPKDTMYNGNIDRYFKDGLCSVRFIEEALAAAGKNSVKSVLDLPCGHGRVLRFLVRRFPRASFTACEIDRDAVDFCVDTFNAEPLYSKTNLDELETVRRYDLIWCSSLVTHLRQDKVRELLRFFHRNLEQGGVVVFTAQGDRALEVMLGREFNFCISDESIAAIASSYQQEGFGYADYPDAFGYGLGEYGVTLTSPAWIRAEIERIGGLKEIYFKPGVWAFQGFQDVFGIIRYDE